MPELEEVLESLGGEIHKKTNITQKEIVPISQGLAAHIYRDKCAKMLDDYNDLIDEAGEDREEVIKAWFKAKVENGDYPLLTFELLDKNLEVRHSWNGWMVERKFGYGALAKMSESGVSFGQETEIRPPVLSLNPAEQEEKKKKHWWSRK